uniref:Uncharacterized protein n=1 Tax=Hyaloperonospora arabidopsidis (strain Emoy2) TaxID=559515 RepID=M4BGP0_HYAAE
MKRFKRLYSIWVTSRDNWSNESRAKMGRTHSRARTRRFSGRGVPSAACTTAGHGCLDVPASCRGCSQGERVPTTVWSIAKAL